MMKLNTEHPSVSCLCITKNKLNILARSINCFLAQTYVNRELIIVKQGCDAQISAFIQSLNFPNIKLVEISAIPILSLGELRNIAIENSNGDFFCVWDDDDWQHADRITFQVNATLGNMQPASAFTNLIGYNQLSRQAYFTNYRLWEGTILCKKEIFLKGLKYPALSKGEDTSFLVHLLRHSKIYPIVNSHHYIYIYHGENTWNVDHFNKNIFHQPLSKQASIFINDILQNDYSVNKASEALNKGIILKEINYFYNPNRKK